VDVRWELLDLSLWLDLVDSLIRDHLCAHVFAVYHAKTAKHINYIFTLWGEISLLISAKNFKLSSVKDPSL
jgi:hypothetical protein